MRRTMDRYTKFIVTVIAIQLCLISVGMWQDTPMVATPAYGNINPGLQMEQLIETVSGVQRSVDKLAVLLVSGEVKVKVVEPKKTKSVEGLSLGAHGAKPK
ncbi:MAG: hypothetical protein IID32_06760 [Planctomycetes bacterium]|nr:hypothetical protein [Planctomycetota bacterium]